MLQNFFEVEIRKVKFPSKIGSPQKLEVPKNWPKTCKISEKAFNYKLSHQKLTIMTKYTPETTHEYLKRVLKFGLNLDLWDFFEKKSFDIEHWSDKKSRHFRNDFHYH